MILFRRSCLVLGILAISFLAFVGAESNEQESSSLTQDILESELAREEGLLNKYAGKRVRRVRKGRKRKLLKPKQDLSAKGLEDDESQDEDENTSTENQVDDKILKAIEEILEINVPENADLEEKEKNIVQEITSSARFPRQQGNYYAPQYEYPPNNRPYNINYTVLDDKTGITHVREEAGDGQGYVVGMYEVVEPGCNIRRVCYKATDEGGFEVLEMIKETCKDPSYGGGNTASSYLYLYPGGRREGSNKCSKYYPGHDFAGNKYPSKNIGYPSGSIHSQASPASLYGRPSAPSPNYPPAPKYPSAPVKPSYNKPVVHSPKPAPSYSTTTKSIYRPNQHPSSTPSYEYAGYPSSTPTYPRYPSSTPTYPRYPASTPSTHSGYKSPKYPSKPPRPSYNTPKPTTPKYAPSSYPSTTPRYETSYKPTAPPLYRPYSPSTPSHGYAPSKPSPPNYAYSPSPSPATIKYPSTPSYDSPKPTSPKYDSPYPSSTPSYDPPKPTLPKRVSPYPSSTPSYSYGPTTPKYEPYPSSTPSYGAPSSNKYDLYNAYSPKYTSVSSIPSYNTPVHSTTPAPASPTTPKYEPKYPSTTAKYAPSYPSTTVKYAPSYPSTTQKYVPKYPSTTVASSYRPTTPKYPSAYPSSTTKYSPSPYPSTTPRPSYPSTPAQKYKPTYTPKYAPTSPAAVPVHDDESSYGAPAAPVYGPSHVFLKTTPKYPYPTTKPAHSPRPVGYSTPSPLVSTTKAPAYPSPSVTPYLPTTKRPVYGPSYGGPSVHSPKPSRTPAYLLEHTLESENVDLVRRNLLMNILLRPGGGEHSKALPTPKVDVKPEGNNAVIIKLTFPYGSNINGLRAYTPKTKYELSEFISFSDAIPEYSRVENIGQGKDEIQVKIEEDQSGYVRPKRNENEEEDKVEKLEKENKEIAEDEDENEESEKESILKKLTDFIGLN